MNPKAETRRRFEAIVARPKGRRLGLLGLGTSGKAMLELMGEQGFDVLAVDGRDSIDDLPHFDFDRHFGAYTADIFNDCEALVLSPGVDPKQAAVEAVWASGRPVFGELALCSRQEFPASAAVVGITGTNGKSTTAALIAHLLGSDGVFLGGNFGTPYCEARKVEDLRYIVAELSSYQLETAFGFEADVSVLLNIQPDHLERYPQFESYVEAKAKLLGQQRPSGRAIVGIDCEHCRRVSSSCLAQVLGFSTQRRDGDVFVERGEIRSQALPVLNGFPLAHPVLFGAHNIENAVAALLAVHCLAPDLSVGVLKERYLSFEGLEHRLERVGTFDGVVYINDSKATNDVSAATALRAISGPVWLLLGGRAKGAGYDGLKAALVGRKLQILSFGEAAEEIAEAFDGLCELRSFTSMELAVQEALENASSGTTVLLSPACSSFDAFVNYAARGDAFRAQVLSTFGGGV